MPREILFDAELARLAPGGIVTLSGGGGKTSLLFALGNALAESGKTVFLTTTTRMLRPEPDARLDVVLTDAPENLAPPPGGRALYAASPSGAAGDPPKVRGYAPEAVDGLARRNVFDWLIVEADGAAGRPLKAPAAHEPVIPSATAVAVAVVGLRCLGQPFSPDIAFRFEETAAITGLSAGETITPRAVAKLAAHPGGWFKSAPANAPRLVFCNQADVPGGTAAGLELADAILSAKPDLLRGVYIGSIRERGLRCLMR